jgi:hypothetical protein
MTQIWRSISKSEICKVKWILGRHRTDSLVKVFYCPRASNKLNECLCFFLVSSLQ